MHGYRHVKFHAHDHQCTGGFEMSKTFSHSVIQMQPSDIEGLVISYKIIYEKNSNCVCYQGDGDSCSTPGRDAKKSQESTPDMHKGVPATEEPK